MSYRDSSGRIGDYKGYSVVACTEKEYWNEIHKNENVWYYITDSSSGMFLRNGKLWGTMTDEGEVHLLREPQEIPNRGKKTQKKNLETEMKTEMKTHSETEMKTEEIDFSVLSEKIDAYLAEMSAKEYF